MAGIHADRGDTTHRLVSGEKPEVGLRVFTNNLDRGVIVEVSDEGLCGYYCQAWHTVRLDTSFRGEPVGGTTLMNCDRLTTTWQGKQA